jgi:CheY-like chemotaxis protein/HPt (histidine-containing phosphotransfer) domain-containing protein
MADSGARKGRLTGIRMLVVDDNAVNRLVLQSMAEHEGARVTSYENGVDAVKAVERAGGSDFDVVITDIQMPVMDGFEATRRMRALAPDLPVLGLSAHVAREDVGDCLSAGMRECLTKPLDMPELVAAIMRHVGDRSASAGGMAIPAVESPTVASGSHDAIVDWARLEARYVGKPALLARLLAIPGQRYVDRPEALRTAARSGNLAQLRELAHATKGMAAELFAEPLRTIAQDTEVLAREGRQEACIQAEVLADAFTDFLAEVAAKQKSH